MKENTLVTVGKVTGVHGLAGNLKIWSFDGTFDIFCEGRSIQLKPENGTGVWYQIKKMTPYKKGVLLILEDIEDRDQAQALVGQDILMDRADLPKLEENTYYWQDLLGLDVIDQHKKNIGKIDSIFSTGAHDVLVVKNKSREIMVPLVEAIVLSVNIKDRTVDIDLPEGL